MSSVVYLTVAHDLCIGCGVCEGVCPHGYLRMQFNPYGEYNPIEVTKCDQPKCRLCQIVCPYLPDIDETAANPNEDQLAKDEYANQTNIQYLPETGYYLKSFVGHVNCHERRISSASGGLLTWVLEQLLTQDEVDYVIAVEQRKGPSPLFAYRVCSTVEEIRHCSRSVYYPVEIGQMLRDILKKEGRYAVVALPCVTTALRLAQKRMPKIRSRIKFILGLTCGQTKSSFFTESLCSIVGGDVDSISQATFRIKDLARSATDYGFECIAQAAGGQQSVVKKTLFFNEGMGDLFVNRHFTPSACFFCDDVFSECADATFMDAWLPRYYQDGRGHNLVICRKNKFEDLLMSGVGVNVQEIPIDEVIKSQAGVVKNKSEMPSFYINWLQNVRVMPYRRKKSMLPSMLGGLQSAKFKILWRIAQQSRRKWLESNSDIVTYKKQMVGLITRLYLLKNVAEAPRRIISKMFRVLKGKVGSVE